MKMTILLAGALTLAATSQLAAEPGKSKGKGQGNGGHSTMDHSGGKAAAKADKKAHKSASNGVIRTDRNGRLYAFDARGNCPPGLAKRNNGCTPPGQAKKRYDVGQRYNPNFGNAWSYDQIPDALRNQYNLDSSDRYYYNQGHLYRVDEQSSLVEQVISALLR